MKKKLFIEAQRKLTKLGRVLFYSYLLLICLGVGGMVFGLAALVLKLLNNYLLLNTSLWEAMLLIIVSWFVTKIFTKEIYALVGIEGIKKLRQDEVTISLQADSKVVPFIRKKIDKSDWPQE